MVRCDIGPPKYWRPALDDEIADLVARIQSPLGDPEAFKRLSELIFLAGRKQRRTQALQEAHEKLLERYAKENEEE